MRKVKFAFLSLGLAGLGFATNGDLLIGVGAVSRSMGGIGIALKTDPDSVIFSNPALMSEFERTTFTFGGTLFMPHTKGRVGNNTFSTSATSEAKYFAIPSIAVIQPLGKNWTFGIAAYGISGMGVDYRNTDVDCNPLDGKRGCYAIFQMMEISPSIAYRFDDSFSVGFGLDVAYGALDLGEGMSSDYKVGFQAGILYKFSESLSVGAVVKSPIPFHFNRVMRFGNSTELSDMNLEQPWQFGIGIGFKPLPDLRVGFDVNYIKWSDAEGYKDFGWDDQWVFKVGGEYKVNETFTLRAGYNYGKSPVDGRTIPADPQLEGAECMRIIGFPAIVEHHLTLGVGVKLTEFLRLDLSYMHAFENSVESRAADGNYWKSKLSEDSISFSLTWSF